MSGAVAVTGLTGRGRVRVVLKMCLFIHLFIYLFNEAWRGDVHAGPCDRPVGLLHKVFPI